MTVRGGARPAFWWLDAPDQHPAILDEQGQSWTYGQLRRTVEHVERELNGPPRLVALVVRNTTAALVHYLALLRNGWPVLLLDDRTELDVVEALVHRFRIRDVWRCVGLDMARETRPGDGVVAFDPDLALLLPTSGSTGQAKIVMLSRHALQANAEAIVEYLDIDADERAITSLPMAYSYGLSIIHSHWLAGACLVLTNASVLEPAFWSQFRRGAVTSLAGVPLQYDMLDRLGWQRIDWGDLRTLTQAGGRLEPRLAERVTGFARETGKRFFIMYGQTEATARMAYLAAHREPEAVESIGRAIPGGRLTVRDEQGAMVTMPGVTGELWYEGPNVMMGYASDWQSLSNPERPAALATGDLAQFDEAGRFRIVGRRSRFLKLSGRRFDLETLQQTFREESWPVWLTGDDRRLVVIAESGADLSALRNHCQSRLALPPGLVRVLAVDVVPMTSSGKPDYRRMQELADAAGA